jgi:hypothetical protein
MSEPVFKLSRVPGAPVSDDELVSDLRRVAALLVSGTVTGEQYESYGTYNRTTLQRRFGSWNEALQRADLKISLRQDYPTEELFENILGLWQYYGRQPRLDETYLPPSKISGTPYQRQFRSWTKALRAFVDYANDTSVELAEHSVKIGIDNKHKTGRNPSLRLRWRVLQRDNFKCCGCGASPAITLGVELHVDHIDPWSKGGETVLENLQTLCSKCNLGKSNLLPEFVDLQTTLTR